ncbi:MAG: hypothetical protein Q7S01_00640 [bacterium]|nr:hypothetical protein [bacterium]
MRARFIGFSAFAFAALSFPLAAMAQYVTINPSGNTGRDLNGVLDVALRLLNNVIILFITIAVVVFFWGLIQYLAKIGGEDGAKKGASLMLWGIIALFVMVSVWGLIRILQSTFSINPGEQALQPSTFNRTQ